MNESSVRVEVTQDLIKPILDARIAAELMKALPNYESLLTGIITHVLQAKVDNNGKIDYYHSSYNPTLLNYLAEKGMRETVEKTLKEYFEKPEVQKEFRKKVEKAFKEKIGEIESKMIADMLNKLITK